VLLKKTSGADSAARWCGKASSIQLRRQLGTVSEDNAESEGVVLMSELKIQDWRVTCEAAPVQIEGTLSDGRSFYWRSRHRNIRLEVPKGTIVVDSNWKTHDEHPVSSMPIEDAKMMLHVMLGLFESTEQWMKRQRERARSAVDNGGVATPSGLGTTVTTE